MDGRRGRGAPASAGVVQQESLDTTEAIWDRVEAIDLKGTSLCIQAVYPHMKARGYGKIVWPG